MCDPQALMKGQIFDSQLRASHGTAGIWAAVLQSSGNHKNLA